MHFMHMILSLYYKHLDNFSFSMSDMQWICALIPPLNSDGILIEVTNYQRCPPLAHKETV